MRRRRRNGCEMDFLALTPPLSPFARPRPTGPDDEQQSSEKENGLQKLCARGHWRPAEDAKLRFLVAQHGPQNWNLIAEKVEGRSGEFG